MAGAYVQTARNSANAAFANITPAGGNLLVYQSGTSLGGGTPTVTAVQAMSSTGGGGSVLATFTIPSATATQNIASSWSTGAYLENIPSGVQSILATFSGGTPATTGITIVEVSGLATASPLIVAALQGQTNPGTGTDAITSGTANVSSIPAYILGICDNSEGSSIRPVVGTNFTLENRVNFSAVEDRREISATGNYATTFTSSAGASNSYRTYMFAFSEPVGGGAILMGQACL